MSDNNTLDLTEITSEPVESNIQVEIVDAPDTDEPEEVPEEPEEVSEPVIATPDQEPVEDPEPVIATPDPEPVIATPDPEPVEDPEPVIATPDPDPDPVETVSPAPVGTDSAQVAADIRNILTEVPTTDTDSSELSDDLKQRIAELDYLRECCSSWVGSGRRGKSNFLTAWSNKSVSVDSNVNYEDTLEQLEKLPELVGLMAESKITTESNQFKNIESYTLGKPLFNDKSVEEKVEVLELLVGLLTDCANKKIHNKGIILHINNLY